MTTLNASFSFKKSLSYVSFAVISLAISACSISDAVHVRQGISPQNADDNVRFRTTYYFRSIDTCEPVEEPDESQYTFDGRLPASTEQVFIRKNRVKRVLKDTLYRFTMTGKSSPSTNKIRFESGTLKSWQIDPFGAGVALDKKNNRFYWKSQASVQREAEQTEAFDEIERFREFSEDLRNKNENSSAADAIDQIIIKRINALEMMRPGEDQPLHLVQTIAAQLRKESLQATTNVTKIAEELGVEAQKSTPKDDEAKPEEQARKVLDVLKKQIVAVQQDIKHLKEVYNKADKLSSEAKQAFDEAESELNKVKTELEKAEEKLKTERQASDATQKAIKEANKLEMGLADVNPILQSPDPNMPPAPRAAPVAPVHVQPEGGTPPVPAAPVPAEVAAALENLKVALKEAEDADSVKVNAQEAVDQANQAVKKALEDAKKKEKEAQDALEKASKMKDGPEKVAATKTAEDMEKIAKEAAAKLVREKEKATKAMITSEGAIRTAELKAIAVAKTKLQVADAKATVARNKAIDAEKTKGIAEKQLENRLEEAKKAKVKAEGAKEEAYKAAADQEIAANDVQVKEKSAQEALKRLNTAESDEEKETAKEEAKNAQMALAKAKDYLIKITKNVTDKESESGKAATEVVKAKKLEEMAKETLTAATKEAVSLTAEAQKTAIEVTENKIAWLKLDLAFKTKTALSLQKKMETPINNAATARKALTQAEAALRRLEYYHQQLLGQKMARLNPEDTGQCGAGSNFRRGFQLIGPEGVKTFDQDDRLLMVMSSSPSPVLGALQELSGRMLKQQANPSDRMLPLVEEQLRINKTSREIPSLEIQPVDQLKAKLESMISTLEGDGL